MLKARIRSSLSYVEAESVVRMVRTPSAWNPGLHTGKGPDAAAEKASASERSPRQQHSEGIAYKSLSGEIAMGLRVGRMGPTK